GPLIERRIGKAQGREAVFVQLIGDARRFGIEPGRSGDLFKEWRFDQRHARQHRLQPCRVRARPCRWRFDARQHHSASAPEMISISSLVIIAWRVRLYLMVCLRIMSPALRVALSIALMRAPCSEAAFSKSARNTWTEMLRGSS